MAEWILLLVFGGVIVLGVLRKLNRLRIIHVEFEVEPNKAAVQVKTSKRKRLKS